MTITKIDLDQPFSEDKRINTELYLYLGVFRIELKKYLERVVPSVLIAMQESPGVYNFPLLNSRFTVQYHLVPEQDDLVLLFDIQKREESIFKGFTNSSGTKIIRIGEFPSSLTQIGMLSLGLSGSNETIWCKEEGIGLHSPEEENKRDEFSDLVDRQKAAKIERVSSLIKDISQLLNEDYRGSVQHVENSINIEVIYLDSGEFNLRISDLERNILIEGFLKEGTREFIRQTDWPDTSHLSSIIDALTSFNLRQLSVTRAMNQQERKDPSPSIERVLNGSRSGISNQFVEEYLSRHPDKSYHEAIVEAVKLIKEEMTNLEQILSSLR